MIVERIFENARRDPSRVAVIDDRGRYTTADLAGRVAALAGVIAAATDRPRVGVLLPTGAGFATAFYAALAAGKTVVPINFLLGERETAHIVADSGIDAIVSGPPLADRLAGLPVKVIDLAALAAAAAVPAAQADAPAAPPPPVAMPAIPAREPDDVAVLMYTSGTSGLPKGVVLTYANLAADVAAAIAHAKLDRAHTFLGVLPLFHSTGMLCSLLAPTELMATVVYQGRFSPAGMLKAIKEHQLSVIVAVPSMYGAVARLKDAGPADLAHCYALLSGGEPLPGNVQAAFSAKFGRPIMEGYGLTETIGPVSFNVPGRHKLGTVGPLIPGVSAKFVGDDGADVPQTVDRPPGEDGEVWLKGPMIMKGYHQLPAETADALTPDGYFKTGDLGRLDADGYLSITGRKKDLIIVAGEKAVPREIEEALLTHPAVAQAAALGRKDPSRGEVVVAFVSAKEGQTVKPEELRELCRQRGLVQWKIPREVFVIDALPLSPTGKVLKRVLAERLATMAAEG